MCACRGDPAKNVFQKNQSRRLPTTTPKKHSANRQATRTPRTPRTPQGNPSGKQIRTPRPARTTDSDVRVACPSGPWCPNLLPARVSLGCARGVRLKTRVSAGCAGCAPAGGAQPKNKSKIIVFRPWVRRPPPESPPTKRNLSLLSSLFLSPLLWFLPGETRGHAARPEQAVQPKGKPGRPRKIVCRRLRQTATTGKTSENQ